MPSLLDDLTPMELDERPLDLNEPGWLYEIKFDGWRLMAQFGGGACELRTRKGADATKWFPEVSKSLAAVPGDPYVTDGEICVLDDMGRSDFNRLQERARRRRWYEGADPVVYCIFDLLVFRGASLIERPLLERKTMLANLMAKPIPNCLYVGHFEEDGDVLFKGAVHQLRLEGIVAKRIDSPYQPGTRTANWVKVKRTGAVPPERFRRDRTSKSPP